jgi:hypothetical protein
MVKRSSPPRNEPKRSLWVDGAMHNDFNGVADRD